MCRAIMSSSLVGMTQAAVRLVAVLMRGPCFALAESSNSTPSQAAWRHDGVLGFAAYKVGDSVKTHEAWGMGSYCFFNQGVDIHASTQPDVCVMPGWSTMK